MNIVILNDNATVTGGGGKIALSSAKGLARRGHEVFVMTAVGPIAPDLRDVDGLHIICTGQQEILSDPNRLRAVVQGYWNRVAARRMAELLAGLDPKDTVIHLHTWGKALTSSVVRTAINLGFPLVFTLHDYAMACPTGGLFLHPKQQICRIKPMSLRCISENCDTRNYAHKLWRVGRELVQITAGGIPNRISHFIVLSQLSHEVLTPFFPPNAQIHFVPNFAEVSTGGAADVAQNRNFVFMGRLVREKGPHIFAESARRAGLDAVFVGAGEFEKVVSGIYPQATITGWVSPDEALQHLKQARALVFPSLWYEVQPLVVLEAAALGIPAVVPDTCAAREMITHGETGLVFKAGSIEDLQANLEKLKDPDFAARLGKEAFRRFWSNPPSLDLHLDRLETVYDQMLGRPAPQQAQYAVAGGVTTGLMSSGGAR